MLSPKRIVRSLTVTTVFGLSSHVVARPALATASTSSSARSVEVTTLSAAAQMRRLQSDNTRVVASACSALGEMGIRRAAPRILAAFNRAKDSEVQAKCILALGQLSLSDAAAVLQQIARDPERSSSVRAAAVQGSSLIDGIDTGFIVGLLGDRDHLVQATAAYVLCQLQVTAAIPGIRQLLDSNQRDIRDAAFTAASLWPEAFKQELIGAATEPTTGQEKRIEAVTALDGIASDQTSKTNVREVGRLITSDQSPQSTSYIASLLNDSSFRNSPVEGAYQLSETNSLPKEPTPTRRTLPSASTIIPTSMESKPFNWVGPLLPSFTILLSALLLSGVALFVSRRRRDFEGRQMKMAAMRVDLADFLALARLLDPDTLVYEKTKEIGRRSPVPVTSGYLLDLNRAYSGVVLSLSGFDEKQKWILKPMAEIQQMLTLAPLDESAKKPAKDEIKKLISQIEDEAALLLGNGRQP